MTRDDRMEGEPRTISRWTFECLVWMTTFMLGFTETIAALMVGRALGLAMPGGGVAGLVVANLVLARVVVDGILKWFGLSRSGKTVEVRARTVASPEGEVEDGETVEVRCPRSFIVGLGVMFLAACLVILLILAAVPHDRMEGVGWAYGLLVFFGIMAIHCFYELRWGKPQAWADSSGIWALPVGFHLRARFVPWSEVATCEIETYHDTFGKPVIARPILKRADGKPLLTPNLLYTRFEDQERLIKYIRAKLPKPKVDLWDW